MAKIGTIGIALLSAIALGYGQRLIWLGHEGLESGVYSAGSVHSRLSGDGRVVMSDFFAIPTDRSHPAIWTYQDRWWYLKADGGLTRDPREALVGYAWVISYDGSIVMVRDYRYPDRLLLWKRGIGIEQIPLPREALNWAHFFAMSWDDNWLAGHVDYPPRPGGRNPQRWVVRISPTRQVERIIECFGADMSASGREIVGTCYFYAFHWREDEGVRYLPWTSMNAVSADGRIAAGGNTRWLVDENRVERLFAGRAYRVDATDISADGRVIVGVYQVDQDLSPSVFLWEEGVGFMPIAEAYPALFRRTEALDSSSISADGRYILLWTVRNLELWPAILDRFGYQGDVDVDGCVDDADLLQVLFAFGQTGRTLAEDVNYDYVVDEQDLLLVLEQFGLGCGG